MPHLCFCRTVIDFPEPFVAMGFCAAGEALCAAGFGDESLSRMARQLSRYGLIIQVGDTPLLDQAISQVRSYLASERRSFSIPLRPSGTEFQKAVWQAVQQIPYGETRSYAAIARAIGRPRAVRAVGQAVGRNPLTLFIPCHRVVGRDGKLVGFGGGLERKVALLALESGLQMDI